jgi:hypothetical protein
VTGQRSTKHRGHGLTRGITLARVTLRMYYLRLTEAQKVVPVCLLAH